MSENDGYQLYAYPNTYSIGVHLMLEESGAAYSIINPKTNPSISDTEFYLASPHGRVPALVLPDKTTMCESGAIALHLADSLCNQSLSITADSVDRARYLQWLFYLSSTLQPDVMLIFHPEFYFPDGARQISLIEAAEKRLKQVWAVLEKEYSAQNISPWMFEKGPTAVDFALSTVMLWPECYPKSSQTYPALDAMLLALSSTPSFTRVMAWHEGLTDDPVQRITS